jgi:hypothetical protein
MGFTLKYIRAWMLFAWPHLQGRFRLLFMVAAYSPIESGGPL